MSTENTTSKDEAIASALEAALRAAETTGTFVVEQAPDVIQQLLLFNTVKFGVVAAASACGSIIAGITARKLYAAARRRAEKSTEYYASLDGFREFWTSTLLVAASVSLGVTAAVDGLNFMKITLAPKVWLLEYAASLVK